MKNLDQRIAGKLRKGQAADEERGRGPKKEKNKTKTSAYAVDLTGWVGGQIIVLYMIMIQILGHILVMLLLCHGLFHAHFLVHFHAQILVQFHALFSLARLTLYFIGFFTLFFSRVCELLRTS